MHALHPLLSRHHIIPEMPSLEQHITRIRIPFLRETTAHSSCPANSVLNDAKRKDIKALLCLRAPSTARFTLLLIKNAPVCELLSALAHKDLRSLGLNERPYRTLSFPRCSLTVQFKEESCFVTAWRARLSSSPSINFESNLAANGLGIALTIHNRPTNSHNLTITNA